jgi:hypothetical protein
MQTATIAAVVSATPPRALARRAIARSSTPPIRAVVTATRRILVARVAWFTQRKTAVNIDLASRSPCSSRYCTGIRSLAGSTGISHPRSCNCSNLHYRGRVGSRSSRRTPHPGRHHCSSRYPCRTRRWHRHTGPARLSRGCCALAGRPARPDRNPCSSRCRCGRGGRGPHTDSARLVPG